MGVLYVISVTIHILAAALWVGGMGAFALVVVPAARRTLGESEGRRLLRAVGVRFAQVGWWALGTLLVTGVANLGFRGMLPLVADGAFWTSSFGKTLGAKLALVSVVVVASLAHARDARRQSGPPSAAARARATHLGRATLLVSVGVIVLAVLLVRGGPW
jgi:putative copper resistance protein D